MHRVVTVDRGTTTHITIGRTRDKGETYGDVSEAVKKYKGQDPAKIRDLLRGKGWSVAAAREVYEELNRQQVEAHARKNKLFDRARTKDHWMRAAGHGDFTIWEGAGTNGGEWKAECRVVTNTNYKKGESETFKSRAEAERFCEEQSD